MKLLRKLVLFASASISLSGIAFANNSSTVAPVSQNNVYVSGEIGYGSLDTPDHDLPEVLSHSSGSIAASANIGFTKLIYRNIDNLLIGVELGYDYNGQSKYTQGSGDDAVNMEVVSSDLHFLATATYLLPSGINIFAKTGPAYVKQDLDFSSGQDDSHFSTETSKSQFKPMVAAGIGYQFKNLNIYFQYNHIFGKDAGDWEDLFNSDGNFANIVSVNTYKLGAAFNIAI